MSTNLRGVATTDHTVLRNGFIAYYKGQEHIDFSETVNYILGQKMIDKMQQTVIVDYSSNVDVSAMEYEKLEFEQEVFDFI